MNKLIQLKKYTFKNLHIVILVLTVSLIPIGLINERIWIRKMLERAKYTVATATTDWHQKNNNGVGTDYQYEINHEVYSRTTSFSYKKGDRFLIIFDSIKPKNSKVLDIYPVEADYVGLKISKNGWKYQEVPFDIDSNKIKKYLED